MSNEASTAAASALTVWEIDPAHTHAQFKVRHLMISNVKGEFTKLSGTTKWDTADVTRSTVEVAVDVNSINTREPQRDGHLKSPDFFDAEHYPTISFRSTKITRTDDGTLELTGDLTIRGVTKPVTFELEGPTPETKDPWGNVRVGIEANTTIDRKDFGLTWNSPLEGGGVMVGDKVALSIDAELIKKQ
jgi:polyisoprenoid-binding protein YceI